MPRPPARRRTAALASTLFAALVLVVPAWAQEGEEPEEETPVYPAGTASLVLDGRTSTLAFSSPPLGPVFALAPIAAALGVNLDVGPLGTSYTLHFGDKRVVVGSGSAVVVVEVRGQPAEIHTLRQTPIAPQTGLQVSLDFLERTLGDELGVAFRWDPAALSLFVERQERREIDVVLNVVHQHRLTVVEIQWSALPRYQVERVAEGLDVRLVGDRMRLPAGGRRDPDELVRDVQVDAERIRLVLGPQAGVGEPRLLPGPAPRLIVEVFTRETPREPTTGEEGTAFRPPAPTRSGLHTVVLDPGHGGVETGAVGARGIAEKDLTIQVARTLRRELERRLPVRVLLTREDDVDVPLDTRTAIANHHRADLFVSLHINSSFGGSAHGTETYFLSRQASDRQAAEAAAAENVGEVAAAGPEGTLELILWDLAQSYHLTESQRFANLVQEELNAALGLRDRGVKQAPFRVLMGATMPAVLVELGFLSNAEEEARLESPAYQAQLVDALVRAIVRFKTQLEAPAPGSVEALR